MRNLIKFLISIQLRKSKLVDPVRGFTLVELLVALLIAFLVITPLMGFMMNLMSTDQQEQAKTASEQEIQAALDFITRDLQQAVYIYDGDALKNKSDPDPEKSGISDQIPPGSEKTGVCAPVTGTTCEPILVFWKRKFISDAISIATGKDDAFVYSLVAYYLIKDNSKTWSKAARVARFEISDGVQVQDGSGVDCGTDYPGQKYSKVGSTTYCPDQGFKSFDLNIATTGLQNKMNSWTKIKGSVYKQTPQVLIDFVDQTATPSVEKDKPTCPTGTSRILGSFIGFYACVDTVNTTAQIFLRGNALARLQDNDLDYSKDKQAYFPQAQIRVKGNGYLFTR